MVILIGFLIVFSGTHLVPLLLAGPNYDGECLRANPNGQRAIMLVDQLGADNPNPVFASNVSVSAKNAGYRFDYFPPNTATLGFFARLPLLGYSIIILRTHGTLGFPRDPSAIVTSDNYSNSQHVADQLLNRVAPVDVNGSRYFGLESDFVSDVMCGRFQGTLILAMFCGGGGASNSLAKAFVEKGAAAYVGWDETVTVSHTDLVFASLVNLIMKGVGVDESIQTVMTRLGTDPISGGKLVKYSLSSFSYNVPWWEQYWYIISGGTAATTVGLAKARNTPNGRNRANGV